MNSKLTNTKSVDSLGGADRKNLLLQRLKGNDMINDSNSFSQVFKDPSSSFGINEHKNFSESAPDLNTSSLLRFSAVNEDSIRRGNNYEIKIREEVKEEITREYEDTFRRIKQFTLDWVREYAFAHQEFQTIQICRKQAKLGTLSTSIAGTSKWSGGIEVMRAERDIDQYNIQLETLKKLDHQKSEISIQKRNVTQALSKEKAKLKNLEDERKKFAYELRLYNDCLQSEFKIDQLLNEERYLLIEFIGKGGYSEVWRAYDKECSRSVAIKIQQMNPQWSKEIKEDFKRHSERECQILRSTQHKNVVGFVEKFYIGDDTIALVMEYCGGGDLSMMLRRRGKIPEKEAKLILAQVIGGLLALSPQENYVIHYDLKPANILFSEDEVVKITDFGISKIVESDVSAIQLTSQGVGTFTYAAPETFQRGKSVYITKSVDTWSLGIIFYEMLYGTPQPFSQSENFNSINFPSNVKISDKGKNFITKCLEKDPTKRPDLSTLATDDEYIHPVLVELNL